jgi:hypothetical protein
LTPRKTPAAVAAETYSTDDNIVSGLHRHHPQAKASLRNLAIDILRAHGGPQCRR